MDRNAKKLHRFFSDQGHRNQGYSYQEDTPTPKLIHSSKNRQHMGFFKNENGETQYNHLQANWKAENLFRGCNDIPVIINLDQENSTNTDNIAKLSGSTSETTCVSHRPMKSGTQRFRWNLIFNILVWLIVPLPLWLPFVSRSISYYLLCSVQAVFVFIWTVIGLLAAKNAVILFRNRRTDFIRNHTEENVKSIEHIVAISCYKEPLSLIEKSIETVAHQTLVSQITMVVSFEEKTPEKETKFKELQRTFGKCGFRRLIFTVHPYGIENEIPGKCSNSNYGLRAAIKEMNVSDDQMDNILVTTCDADSKFPPEYLAALTSKYLEENRPALTTIYQSPLFYNWKLDSLSFVTRVTGLLRSLLMLGALIPFNINTMSIFSFSLSLAKKGNFVHPAYQMDDIICLIRWMGVTQRRLRISMIPVPVLSGPTSGDTVEREVIEWARQARRWTIGAAEVFHYFIVKSRHIPKAAAFSWGFAFIVYYGILLCTGGLFGLTTTIAMFAIMKDVPLVVSYVMYGLFALQMLIFAIAFIIDMFIPKLLNVDECIFFLRNIFHFIMTPFVLLAYSFVELYALHELIIFGKKVCKHGASKKLVL